MKKFGLCYIGKSVKGDIADTPKESWEVSSLMAGRG